MSLQNTVSNLRLLASKSQVSNKHAAALLSKRPICTAINNHRTHMKGRNCCALHAEAAVINKAFPRSFRFIRNKWCLLRPKTKKEKT